MVLEFILTPCEAHDDSSKTRRQAVGYIRVSTLDQKTDRQLEGIALNKRFTAKLLVKAIVLGRPEQLGTLGISLSLQGRVDSNYRYFHPQC